MRNIQQKSLIIIIKIVSLLVECTCFRFNSNNISDRYNDSGNDTKQFEKIQSRNQFLDLTLSYFSTSLVVNYNLLKQLISEDAQIPVPFSNTMLSSSSSSPAFNRLKCKQHRGEIIHFLWKHNRAIYKFLTLILELPFALAPERILNQEFYHSEKNNVNGRRKSTKEILGHIHETIRKCKMISFDITLIFYKNHYRLEQIHDCNSGDGQDILMSATSFPSVIYSNVILINEKLTISIQILFRRFQMTFHLPSTSDLELLECFFRSAIFPSIDFTGKFAKMKNQPYDYPMERYDFDYQRLDTLDREAFVTIKSLFFSHSKLIFIILDDRVTFFNNIIPGKVQELMSDTNLSFGTNTLHAVFHMYFLLEVLTDCCKVCSRDQEDTAANSDIDSICRRYFSQFYYQFLNYFIDFVLTRLI